jgi:predicted nucleic acid-binding protein
MPRVPFGRSLPDPRRANTFLDSCAFDPKYHPEDAVAERIRSIRREVTISILLAHSNQKEIEHPNTPADVKAEAADMNYTIETSLTPEEVGRRAKIHAALTGEGKLEKYAADAQHIFEAGRYGGGYFVTTDERLLAKKLELQTLSGAIILKPSEWLRVYEESAYA